MARHYAKKCFTVADGSEGETFHTDVTLKTRLLLQNNPLKVQLRQNFDLESNPQK